MASQVTASSKGQIVLPKRVRERLGIASGTVLDVIDTPAGVELRLARPIAPGSVQKAIRHAQAILDYRGPRIADEEVRQNMEAAVVARWGKKPA